MLRFRGSWFRLRALVVRVLSRIEVLVVRRKYKRLLHAGSMKEQAREQVFECDIPEHGCGYRSLEFSLQGIGCFIGPGLCRDI